MRCTIEQISVITYERIYMVNLLAFKSSYVGRVRIEAEIGRCSHLFLQ